MSKNVKVNIDCNDRVLADDLLKGAEDIGPYIGEEPRRTSYLLERGLLPAFKLGGRWYARKTTLLAHFKMLEEKAAQ